MATNLTNVKERVLHLSDYKGISRELFFDTLGLSYGNFKGKAKEKALSSETLAIIVAAFPDISTDWLLTGNGSMLRERTIQQAPAGRLPRPSQPQASIKFYDVDFAAGDVLFISDTDTISPAYTMDIPELGGCTAFRTYGDSMETLIKSGSILFATLVQEWQSHLEYGQIYGIVCHDNRKYLKYIRKYAESPKTHFLLRSENKDYDDFELPKSAIKSLWLIHGWINKRT